MKSSIDLDRGWHHFPRPKTGIERKCSLWPETIEALRLVLDERPEPKLPEYGDLFFLKRTASRG